MTTTLIVGLSVIGVLFLSVILFFYLNRKTFEAIVNDTLKRDGKWSATYLTMFTAWVAALFAFIVDAVKHNGDVNGAMFGIMVSVALGSKLANSWGKKIEQTGTTTTTNTPDDANKA